MDGGFERFLVSVSHVAGGLGRDILSLFHCLFVSSLVVCVSTCLHACLVSRSSFPALLGLFVELFVCLHVHVFCMYHITLSTLQHLASSEHSPCLVRSLAFARATCFV